jgi:MFS family permease
VPAADFGQAVALSSSSFHVAVIAGPALGGLLYLAGPQVYATSAVLLLASTVLMLVAQSAPQAARGVAAGWHTLLEGLRFVWSRPVVLGAISLDLFAVLFGGATALLPALARDVLHVDSTGLGLLRTAPGVGAAVISVALARWPIERNVGLHVRRRRPVRPRHGGAGLSGQPAGVARRAVRDGRRRHGQRLRAPPAGAARNAGRDPRPRRPSTRCSSARRTSSANSNRA